MLTFDVAVEETIKRTMVRRVVAPTPFAARRIAETGADQTPEGIVEVTEAVIGREINQRIRAVGAGSAHFRSIPAEQYPALGSICGTFEQDDLVIDPSHRTATWKGQSIRLSRKRLRIVLQMALNPGWVIDRGCLLEASGLDDDLATDRAIDSAMKTIRRRFRGVDPEFDMIETVYGHGYRWRDLSLERPEDLSRLELQRNAEGKLRLEVDFDRKLVLLGGYLLPLSGTQIRLFMTMARTPGRLMSNDNIFEIVRKHEGQDYDRSGTARTAIKRIRRVVNGLVPDLDIFDHVYDTGTRITKDVEVVRLKR